MAKSFLLLNDGVSKLLLNDGTSFLLLNEEAEAFGGSGGRVKKKTGQKLISDELGSRPVLQSEGESASRTILRSENKSKAKLVFPHDITSKAKITQLFERGYSLSKLVHKQYAYSQGKIRLYQKAESKGKPEPAFIYQKAHGEIKAWALEKIVKIKKLMELQSLFYQIDNVDKTYEDSKPVILSFEFDEQTDDPTLFAFTHSSSFVGNVRYDSDTQGMRILLNGKAYNFCNVPRRVYDAFEGADSKGAYFARNIRTQFDC